VPGAARSSLLIGAYTAGAGTGITRATYDTASGAIVADAVVPVANPSCLALAPSGAYLYAVDEQADGAVTAFARRPDDTVSVINTRSSGGESPCHLVVHPSGRYVLSANYGSGSVCVHPVRADGGLDPRSDLVVHTGGGPDADRQAGPHPHQVHVDDAGTVLVVDLGTDSVYAYVLDLDAGTLELRRRARLRAGSGPRHLAVAPDGRTLYVATELGSTVVVCDYDAAAATIAPRQELAATISTRLAGGRNYPAGIVVAPDGRFVYLSNRGADEVAVFAVGADGRLTPAGATPVGGSWPRHIALDPTGTLLFCANQHTSSVTTFHVDPASGSVTPTGQRLDTPAPVWVSPLPKK
jgi:6-phosphogluconolactonase